ncbi:MAG: hypothetical protein IJ047_00430 [Paludibacteraceae bacterium]|nr:hypothetical protein [Paludibacteraceae bacterium]
MRAHRQIGFLSLFLVLSVACASPTAESYYLQGKQLREANQPVEAMQAFLSAVRVPSDEFAVKGRAYSNMATMCRIGEQHELAFDLYRQSLNQFVAAKDTLAQAFALNNMAWEKAVLADKQTAFQLLDSALALSSSEAVQTKVLESRAAACLYAGEYDSVLFYTVPKPALASTPKPALDSSSTSSPYFAILRAQAYTFLNHKDSALFYARQVLAETDNPRYLDDAYYILTHCDSTAVADDIRDLASARTDLQRSLERNDPEWIEAMLLAQQALEPYSPPLKPQTLFALIASAILLLLAFAAWLYLRSRRRENALDAQCRLLRQSPDIRSELQWNDYRQFSALCNKLLSGIVSKLEQRGLPERDIRICVLVLIGFSYAEMAQILFRAENGIGKDKYLIAKRLGVSAKQLQETLRSIANSHA